MKTVDMIKTLIECPELKARFVWSDGTIWEAYVAGQSIRCIYGKNKPTEHSDFLTLDGNTMERNWEIVTPGIPFIEAYMAFERKGKIIRWEPDNYPYSPYKEWNGKRHMRDDFEVTGVEIMTGKWSVVG